MTDTESLIRTLDAAESTPDAVRLRGRTYELLRPAGGALVADVGCGTGRAVAELAGLGARAVGVDGDGTMLAAARERFPGIDVRAGDAAALPFEAGELRGYRADKLFHLLPDPDFALAEARRVLAPGGRIVLVGQDWDTIVIDSDRPATTRAIVHARADALPRPRAARAYRNLLLDAGFGDTSLEVHTAVFTDAAVLPWLTRLAGSVGADEAGPWLADQARRAEAGRLMVALPMFVAAATR
ncbi:MAG TPA: methyltransferase domain-containing protein [Dactylosporangium sp.]|nr:methyltransferase domain-containing protein [Dactylosporangium sp.]